MATDIRIVEEASKPLGMNAKKFALWLFMVSVGMLFAALTSAYIVRQAEGNWLLFDLPSLFWVNSGIILVSSITMQWAYVSAKRDNLEAVKLAISITTVLGILFLVGQVMAWRQMVTNDIFMVNATAAAVSGSFVYILSGLHAAHIIGGIIFLLMVLVSTFRYKIHSKNLNQLEMCATYWHFLGGLWLYLFVFLLLYR